MKFSVPRRPEETVDLTPLIDVVFLLLIFFMVSTTFISEPPAGLQLDLPSSEAQDIVQGDEYLVVHLDADRRVFVDERELSSTELSARLGRAAREDARAPVVFRADRTVPHGEVVQLLDEARAAGLRNLVIATEDEGAAISGGGTPGSTSGAPSAE